MPPSPSQPLSDFSFLSPQVRQHRYFFLTSSATAPRDLAVICGGWEQSAPDYRIDREKFSSYGLEYVAEGRGWLKMRGTESPLSPGSIFAYGPSTPHAIRCDPKRPLVKYFLDFSGPRAKALIGRKVLGARGIAFLHEARAVHDLFEQILDAGEKGGAAAPRICALLLEVLALKIEASAAAPAPHQSRSRETFERCRAELEKSYRTTASISDLARRTHLAPAYLSRLFQRFAGERPVRMLTRFKMNAAAAQLFSGVTTVKEVAALVGYPDPYHFSRVFKNYYGSSPMRFRQMRARKLSPRTHASR